MSKKGVTYLELILALAIVSYVVLAFAQLLFRNTLSVQSSQFRTTAYNYAVDKMDEIKNMRESLGFDAISPGSWTAESSEINGKVFTRLVTVSALSSSLKRIYIEVSWSEGGQTRDVEITSMIAAYN